MGLFDPKKKKKIESQRFCGMHQMNKYLKEMEWLNECDWIMYESWGLSNMFYICSARVFGVSAESLQCYYDSKGNNVPTILLLMQERLYSQGGLKVVDGPKKKQKQRHCSRACQFWF